MQICHRSLVLLLCSTAVLFRDIVVAGEVVPTCSDTENGNTVCRAYRGVETAQEMMARLSVHEHVKEPLNVAQATSEALTMLHRLQNPQDCVTAPTIVLIQADIEGFGSRLGRLTAALGGAFHMGRTLVSPSKLVYWHNLWKCGQGDFECFFQPLSKCSYYDVGEKEMHNMFESPYNHTARLLLSAGGKETLGVTTPPARYRNMYAVDESNGERVEVNSNMWWISVLSNYVSRLDDRMLSRMIVREEELGLPTAKPIVGLHVRKGDVTKVFDRIRIKSSKAIQVALSRMGKSPGPKSVGGYSGLLVVSDDVDMPAAVEKTRQDLIKKRSKSDASRGGNSSIPKIIFEYDRFRSTDGAHVKSANQRPFKYRKSPGSFDAIFKHSLEALEELWMLSRCHAIIGSGASMFATIPTAISYLGVYLGVNVTRELKHIVDNDNVEAKGAAETEGGEGTGDYETHRVSVSVDRRWRAPFWFDKKELKAGTTPPPLLHVGQFPHVEEAYFPTEGEYRFQRLVEDITRHRIDPITEGHLLTYPSQFLGMQTQSMLTTPPYVYSMLRETDLKMPPVTPIASNPLLKYDDITGFVFTHNYVAADHELADMRHPSPKRCGPPPRFDSKFFKSKGLSWAKTEQQRLVYGQTASTKRVSPDRVEELFIFGVEYSLVSNDNEWAYTCMFECRALARTGLSNGNATNADKRKYTEAISKVELALDRLRHEEKGMFRFLSAKSKRAFKISADDVRDSEIEGHMDSPT